LQFSTKCTMPNAKIPLLAIKGIWCKLFLWDVIQLYKTNLHYIPSKICKPFLNNSKLIIAAKYEIDIKSVKLFPINRFWIVKVPFTIVVWHHYHCHQISANHSQSDPIWTPFSVSAAKLFAWHFIFTFATLSELPGAGWDVPSAPGRRMIARQSSNLSKWLINGFG